MTKKTRYFLTGSAAVLAGGPLHGAGGLLRRRVPGAGRLDRSDRAGLRAGRRRGRRLRRRPQHHGFRAPAAVQAGRADADGRGGAAGVPRARPASTSRTTSTTSSPPPARDRRATGHGHPNGVVVARGRFDTVKLEGSGARARRAGRGIQRQAAARSSSTRPRTTDCQSPASRRASRRQAKPACSPSSSPASSPSATSPASRAPSTPS